MFDRFLRPMWPTSSFESSHCKFLFILNQPKSANTQISQCLTIPSLTITLVLNWNTPVSFIGKGEPIVPDLLVRVSLNSLPEVPAGSCWTSTPTQPSKLAQLQCMVGKEFKAEMKPYTIRCYKMYTMSLAHLSCSSLVFNSMPWRVFFQKLHNRIFMTKV